LSRAVVGGLVLAAALAGSGCGGGSSKPATVPASTLTKAARDTQAAGTYTFTIGGTIDLGGQTFPIRGGGAVDARGGRARASLDLSQALSLIGISRDEARADAVATGGVLYVRSPYLVRRRGLKRPWIRYPQSVAPLDLLSYMRPVGAVRRVGGDTVDGVKTTHYSAELDISRYASAARLAGDSLPVDVWVDSADRIRRVQTQLGTASFQALPQLDIAGFGRPVAIRTPPAAQVAAPR
jgi:hypothetical protein